MLISGKIKRLNPQAPVGQISADDVVFDVSKVKESSFFEGH